MILKLLFVVTCLMAVAEATGLLDRYPWLSGVVIVIVLSIVGLILIYRTLAASSTCDGRKTGR